MIRYAAKLLFQFRVEVVGSDAKRRICEERIINFSARSDREALRTAKRRGSKAEFSYNNSDGNKVRFQFVGIMDLMSLGTESDPEEVWYDIRTMLMPMERRNKILPKEIDLLKRLAGEAM